MKFKYGNYVLPILAAGMLAFSIIQVVRAQQKAPQPLPPVEPAADAVRQDRGREPASSRPAAKTSRSAPPCRAWCSRCTCPSRRSAKSSRRTTRCASSMTGNCQAQLSLQQANLFAAEAQLQKLYGSPGPEEVPPLEAALEAADFNFKVQADTAKRNKELYPQNAVPEKDYLQSLLLAEQARRQKIQAEANLAAQGGGLGLRHQHRPGQRRHCPGPGRADPHRSGTRYRPCAHRRQGAAGQRPRAASMSAAPPSQALYVIGSGAPLNIRVDIDEHDIPRAFRVVQERSQGRRLAARRPKHEVSRSILSASNRT